MAAARARFGTKIGFILSGVGSAVGLGNIWRFPQLTSQNGGAAFVFAYLPLVIFIGIPLIWAELAVGQRGQGSAVGSVGDAVNKKWRWVGMLMVATSTLFLSYYTIIAGLALKFALFSPTSVIFNDPGSFLASSTQGPPALLMHAVFTVITAGVVTLGVAKGLERANLVMMPTLFLIVIALAIYGLTQPGAAAGLDFYLGFKPGDLSWETIGLAVGQVFFSTSVGFGIMITYGSYNDEGQSLLGSASLIGVADSLVALIAGLMIFPLVFSQGLQSAVIDPNAGATTALFLTIPTAFGAIGGLFGKVLMIVFFVMLTFAALSSSISGLEVLVSFLEDQFDLKRWKSAFLGAEFSYGLGILSALSLGTLTKVDHFVGSILLISGGIGVALLYTFAIKDRVGFLLGGLEDPSPMQVRTAKVASFLIAYVIPLILLVLLVVNLPETVNMIFG